MTEPVLILEKEKGIATVTLNRADKLNALNRELRASFCRTMRNGCCSATNTARSCPDRRAARSMPAARA